MKLRLLSLPPSYSTVCLTADAGRRQTRIADAVAAVDIACPYRNHGVCGFDFLHCIEHGARATFNTLVRQVSMIRSQSVTKSSVSCPARMTCFDVILLLTQICETVGSDRERLNSNLRRRIRFRQKPAAIAGTRICRR